MNCYPIRDIQNYPFYKLTYGSNNKIAYLFGSIHCNKLSTINPNVANILCNCDDLTLERTCGNKENYDYNRLLERYMFDNTSIFDYLYITFNSSNVIEPIKNKNWYNISAKYVFGESLLSKLKTTK